MTTTLVQTRTVVPVMKMTTLKVSVEFPTEVNISGIEEKEFNINDWCSYQELVFAYKVISKKDLYCNIKDKNYKWLFFSDTYETYSNNEAEDLVLNDNFREKWYKNKFMTVYFIDNNFKCGAYVIPATSQEYKEDKAIYDDLYRVLKRNNNVIGKYIKNEKM